MADPSLQQLGRRARQIMEAVYRRGTASVAEVRGDLPDGPSYSTVRTMLRLLEGKGHLRHRADGRRFVYAPVVTPTKARRTAVRNLLATFFGGSVERAVASLLEVERNQLTAADLDRLAALVEQARKEGR